MKISEHTKTTMSDTNDAGAETAWKPFFFESNQFFDTIHGVEDWERLKAAYPEMSDDELLDAKEATYGGARSQEERDARPNYGMRWEHDGERTLRGFFDTHGMALPAGATQAPTPQ